MPFLNFQANALIYEDQDNRKPLRRLPDLTLAFDCIAVGKEKSERIEVQPNEIADVLVKTRGLSWTSSTQLSWERPLAQADNMRLRWTGTGPNPVFRTRRALSTDATTQLTMTRISPNAIRIQHNGGTAWVLTTVVVNDLIRFEPNTDAFTNPFLLNVGKTYRIQAVGSDYVDFVDGGAAGMDQNIVLGTGFDLAVRIMTAGPVRVGDRLAVAGASLNQGNAGEFEITDVSTDYVEFIAPLGVAETALYGTNSINIYDRLIGFVLIRTTGAPIKLRFGDQTEWTDLKALDAKTPPLMMATLSTWKVQAMNTGTEMVELMITHAEALPG